MADKIPDYSVSQLGIASIELWNEGAIESLPDNSRLQPIQEQVEAKLEEILQPKTMDAEILKALRPKIEDRGIFRPGTYYALRDAILAKLEKLLPKVREEEVIEELNQAIEFLKQQNSAHDVGEQNRYALLKG